MDQPPRFPPGPPNFVGPPSPPPFGRPPEPAGPPAPPPIAESVPGLNDRQPPSGPPAVAVLRNPLILGGLAVVVVLLLTAIVLIVIGGEASAPARSVSPSSETPERTEAPLRVRGLLGRARVTTTVRAGPGPEYAVLGVLRKGAEVDVVGRDEDASWLQAYYPPGSQLKAWVEVDAIDVEGDVSTLSIGQPSAGPSIAVPTEPIVAEEEEEPAEELPTEPPEPTEPSPLPTDSPPPPAPTDTPPPALPTDTPPLMTPGAPPAP